MQTSDRIKKKKNYTTKPLEQTRILLYTLNMEMLEIISVPCISPFSGYLTGAGAVESKSWPFNFEAAAIHRGQELEMTSGIQFTCTGL